MTLPQEEYLSCVELACDRLDGLQQYSIHQGDAHGLLVMHGIAMYARDTARAAATLLRQGHTLAAAALARVVIEHAVLAQWVAGDSEGRGLLLLEQSEVERTRWFEVVLDANFDPKDPLIADLNIRERAEGSAPPKLKNVAREFDTVKNLFGGTGSGRQLYLTYRNLSRFVHPSVATFARYTELLKLGGLELRTTIQVEQDPESIAFYLASALAMCALPYFEMLGEVEAGVSVGVAAKAAELVTKLA